jgi:hypothetical protein
MGRGLSWVSAIHLTLERVLATDAGGFYAADAARDCGVVDIREDVDRAIVGSTLTVGKGPNVSCSPALVRVSEHPWRIRSHWREESNEYLVISLRCLP